MAPDLKQVEEQTLDVLQCLFDDDHGAAFRTGEIEHDGPDDGNDTFDPVVIAEKLKAVADNLNKDAEIRAAMRDLQRAAAQEVLDQTLSSIVTLAESQVKQSAEVAPELLLIKASVAVGLYVKKTYPNMRDQLQRSIGSFLNQRVGHWVVQQGGWGEVARASQL